MEVNEEIVKDYFVNILNCFVMENILFKTTIDEIKNNNKNKSGWSDIDILALDTKNKEIYDIEVKYRHATVFHKGKDKTSSLSRVINQFFLKERTQKIKTLNPMKFKVRKIFVTNKKAFSKNTREEYINNLNEKKIEVKFIDDIFVELQEYYKKNSKKISSVLGQTFRLIEVIK